MTKEIKHAKILLTCIFKDDSELDIIKRMLESFMPYMQGLCVALTGTSGKFTKLEKLLKKYGAAYVITTPETHPQIYTTINSPKLSKEEFEQGNEYLLPEDITTYEEYLATPNPQKPVFSNFAAARQVTFDLAAQLEGYDWWSWADADDILVTGKELQDCADKSLELKLDGVFFTYWYAVRIKPDNTFTQDDVIIEHIRERLLRPGIFKWVSRLHEVAIQKDDNFKPKYATWDFNVKEGREIVWAHLAQDDRVMEALKRNCDILEIQAREENHKDPRTLFYLAKTYYDLKDRVHLTLALELLKEYLFGEFPSGWAEERANAYGYMATIYGQAGKHKEAIEALHEALKEYPENMFLILSLAKEYDAAQDFTKANYWLDVASHMIPPTARTTIGNPLEIKILAASLEYNKSIRSGQLDEAIRWLKIREALTGEVELDRIKTLEGAISLNKAGERVFNYAKWLKDNDYSDKIPYLLQSLPTELSREQFAQYIANEIQDPKVWGDKSIVYFAGSIFAEWDPKTALTKGLGGSESAVINLSEQWVKAGYDVTVYANVTEEGEVNGVNYKYYTTINWKDQFNILILWRQHALLDFDLKAKKVFLDLHDVLSNLDFTPERVAKVDKVFFKSNYHRSIVPSLPEEKVRIISNGI